MLEVKLSPSMMCVDPWDDPARVLHQLQSGGAAYLHMDIMDGHFVSNLMLGTGAVKSLRRASGIPLDIHLMVDNPRTVLPWLDVRPGEYVSVHVESDAHLHRLLEDIRARGAKPMAALNPATPLHALEEVLGDIDGVLLMTVDPGFAGQPMIPHAMDKIKRLRAWLDETGHPDVEIEVDGNVSFENAARMRAAGANLFVAGTSSVFAPGGTIAGNIARLQKLLAGA